MHGYDTMGTQNGEYNENAHIEWVAKSPVYLVIIALVRWYWQRLSCLHFCSIKKENEKSVYGKGDNMKKYIIIAGVPRAGKSTVSQMITKKLGYQHISMDSILAGIEKVFPETNVNTDAPIDSMTNLEHFMSG